MSISTVTSEALQLKLRELLPSQQGFSTDISASDTIIPIIDLTAAAEGSGLDVSLQQAIAFGSQTEFEAVNSTAVIANSPGFYKIQAGITIIATTAANTFAEFQVTDGATTKTIWGLETIGFINTRNAESVEFIVFLDTGESVQAVSNQINTFIKGSSRQIATSNGTLVNPSGFTPQ